MEARDESPMTTRDMRGRWLYTREKRYGDETTYQKAALFLDGLGDVEDWGCGTCYARRFFRHSRYTGIDGSGPFADKAVDLRYYTSAPDCICMRHVLEHNVHWKPILINAVASFRSRMVLVVFTPFGDRTRVLRANHNGIPDISFKKADLTGLFRDRLVSEESLRTNSQYGIEHVFYVEKNLIKQMGQSQLTTTHT